VEIRAYDPSMADELAVLYNRAVSGTPHCYPTAVEELAAAIARVRGQADSDPPLRDKAALVAVDHGNAVGFADTAIGRPHDGESRVECGVFPFFWYEPGRRAVGQALLDAAETRLQQLGARAIQAFPQEYKYDCYHLHSAYLSDHLAHVGALLALNGYRRTRGEVYYDWPDFEPVEPPPAGVEVDVAVEWRAGRDKRPNLSLVAHRAGKEIGCCYCDACSDWVSAADAADWFMTCWLCVEESHQGLGLGKHLLRRALVEMRGAGFRHAAISTALGNDRASVFYSNFGYRFCDWTYGLKRDLPPGA